MTKQPKRAITLGGGGPAAGLHIGALKALDRAGIKFDVWALSCIGAWVGVIYNQSDAGDEVAQTERFFREGVFRDDDTYSRFPVNAVFGPDLFAIAQAVNGFLLNPANYDKIFLPGKMLEACRETLGIMSDRRKWNEGDLNQWVLDQVLAVHPLSRFWTSLIYLSELNGLARIYYPESSFLTDIKFSKLYEPGKPFIYHNAWNLTRSRMESFANKRPDWFDGKKDVHGNSLKDLYGEITDRSLCACSALPYVEQTIKMDNGEVYCEGALVDTVNFKYLLEHNPDLDEVWVSRIVDPKQVKAPRNLYDALGNLCMLFAGALGDDDVKLFKYHARIDNGWKGQIVEIQVSENVNFDWSHKNLDLAIAVGEKAAEEAIRKYRAGEFRYDKQREIGFLHKQVA